MMNRFSLLPVLFLAMFGIWSNGYAQVVAEIDSSIVRAKERIYDEPDKAVRMAEDIFNLHADNPEIQVEALLVMSNASISKRDYEKSLEYALQAEQISAGTKNNKIKLMSLSQTANLYHQLGVNDKALEILDKADKIQADIQEMEPIYRVVGINNAIRGFIYREQLNCELAIKYFDKADEYFAAGMNTNNRSVVTYNKGNCFITLGKLDSASVNYKKAKMWASITDAKSLIGFACKGLAEVYTLEGRYEDSLKELEVADSISRNVGDLILNRGIYKGYTDNFSALKDWDQFHFYNDKLEAVTREIKTSERRTIQNLIKNYSYKIKKEEKSISTRFGISILIMSVLFLALLFRIISKEISFKKEIKDAKSKIKL